MIYSKEAEIRRATEVTTSTDDPAHRTYILFAFFWAVFTLVHQGKPAIWARTPIEALQTVAAFAVLFNPRSLHAFLSLVVLQMLDVLLHMPRIVNHAAVALTVDLTILAVVGNEVLRRPHVPLTGARIYRLFAPAVRVQVIIVYAIAVLHKLNWGFLNPEISCAPDHARHLSGLIARVVGVNLLPNAEALNIVLIAATLAAEAGIPLLLLFARTRVAGIALGLLFHYILGVNVFHDFSGMIYTLFILFAPTNFMDLAAEWWNGSALRSRLNDMRRRMVPKALPGPTWVVIAGVALVLATGNQWVMAHPTILITWAVYAIGVIVLFCIIVFRQHAAFYFEPRAFRFHPALAPIVALVALFGMTPYLGLKTETSFSMFSNLRTEGGVTNHLFIPASTQIFDFQSDLVTIKDSNQQYLRDLTSAYDSQAKRWANGTLEVPFFEVRYWISLQQREGRQVSITYVRNGVERTVQRAELDPELSAEYPWLWRKTQYFRPVEPGFRQACRH